MLYTIRKPSQPWQVPTKHNKQVECQGLPDSCSNWNHNSQHLKHTLPDNRNGHQNDHEADPGNSKRLHRQPRDDPTCTGHSLARQDTSNTNSGNHISHSVTSTLTFRNINFLQHMKLVVNLAWEDRNLGPYQENGHRENGITRQ